MSVVNVFNNYVYDGHINRMLSTQWGAYGEIMQVANTIVQLGEKDQEANMYDLWEKEWGSAAAKAEKEAEDILGMGHKMSACDAYCRAAYYYLSTGAFRVYMHKDAVKNARRCVKAAIPMLNGSCFEEAGCFGYFIPGEGSPEDSGNRPPPTLIVIGGFDHTAESLFFLVHEGAKIRGYNLVVVDDGNAGAFYERNLRRQYRYEDRDNLKKVISAVVSRKDVDPDRVALFGLDVGGFFAIRAAAFDKRLKAVVLNPPVRDIFEWERSKYRLQQIRHSQSSAPKSSNAKTLSDLDEILESVQKGIPGEGPTLDEQGKSLLHKYQELMKKTKEVLTDPRRAVTADMVVHVSRELDMFKTELEIKKFDQGNLSFDDIAAPLIKVHAEIAAEKVGTKTFAGYVHYCKNHFKVTNDMIEKIDKPLLVLCSKDVNHAKAKEFYDKVEAAHPEQGMNSFKMFSEEDACTSMYQEDNLKRLYQVMFDWLDQTFVMKVENDGPIQA